MVCGFPREDYLLMSELAIDLRFQRRGFGKLLVSKFEMRGFKKYNQINVGALDGAINFYKSLNYSPFLLVQFENNEYSKKNFANFEVLSIKEGSVELKIEECSLEKLIELRKIFPKAHLQYIFVKKKSTNEKIH